MNLLYFLASLSISPSYPTGSELWSTNGWVKDGAALVLEATSDKILSHCSSNPNGYVSTPTILQGVQTLFVNGQEVETTGASDLNVGSSVYSRIDLDCSRYRPTDRVTWRVRTTSLTYAKFAEWPNVENGKPLTSYLVTTALVLAAGSLLFLGVVSGFFFSGVLANEIPISVLGSCFGFSMFFIFSHPEGFGIRLEEVALHKTHDVFLMIAMIFIWNLYRLICGVPRIVQRFQVITAIFGIIIIFISENLDESQIGTSLGFVGSFVCLITMFVIQTKHLFAQKFTRASIFQFASVAIFCGTAVNEILINSGLIEGLPLFSLGSLATMFTLALAANEKVVAINQDRDYLRHNLEKEVTAKTRDISKTLDDLKRAQAEIVHSAKLASLGTLSAGIAHEINNSLNYPTGAVKILKRLLTKETIGDKEKKMATEIVTTMEDGLLLTAEIIKNLKTYTGTKSEITDHIRLKELVDGTLSLMRSRIGESIRINIDVTDTLEVCFSKASLAQIIMNLLSNGVDAIKEKQQQIKVDGLLIVRASTSADGMIQLHVQDNGTGIPDEVKDRIFDPFFTTKQEGSGTGLGLHIVQGEMRKMGGSIQIATKRGEGTTFTLVFPSPEKYREMQKLVASPNQTSLLKEPKVA